MKKLTLKDFQERLELVHSKEKLLALEWNGSTEISSVKCLSCETIYEKTGAYFLDKRKVSICKNCFPTQPNELKKDWTPPDEYILLSEYRGMQNKVKLKHSCGFIWEMTPSNLKMGKGCPKCNRKISKGEQKIINFLKLKNIEFRHQVPISIQDHHLTIDFYIPEKDLYIEYNGEQHYHPIKHFGGESKFKQQVYLDKLKKDFLGDKLLIISYKDFDNIESILKSSTTIPMGVGSKPMTAEAEET